MHLRQKTLSGMGKCLSGRSPADEKSLPVIYYKFRQGKEQGVKETDEICIKKDENICCRG